MLLEYYVWKDLDGKVLDPHKTVVQVKPIAQISLMIQHFFKLLSFI